MALPSWLETAINLLSGGLIDPSGRAGAPGIPGLPSVIDPFERGGLQVPFLFRGPAAVAAATRRRRRRRQALTQGDRNSIAFIAATVSKRAAGEFAVQLVTRSR